MSLTSIKVFYIFRMHQEEDSKSLMGKDRRREAISLKLQRLEDSITKAKKDIEGKLQVNVKAIDCRKYSRFTSS